MATRPFYSTRWGQWMMVAALVLILVAVFTPAYSYDGPGPGGVGKIIAHRRRDEGAWPGAYRDPARRFDYALERVEIGGAVYRIRTGREREERWVTETGRSYRIEP